VKLENGRLICGSKIQIVTAVVAILPRRDEVTGGMEETA